MSGAQATYGELTHVAARAVAMSAASLASERLADRSAAETALQAYSSLLFAAGVQVERLAGGGRRIQILAQADWTEPADRAALHLIEALRRAVPAIDPPSTSGQCAPARFWRQAAEALGAAGDVLATHRSTSGADRTPEVGQWQSPAGRAQGYRDIADLVTTVCSADRDLALRSAQAGMPWRSVENRLPSLDDVDSAARNLFIVARQEADFSDLGANLASITVARPALRLGDPVTELRDRFERLRVNAWLAVQQPTRANVVDLSAFATVGVVVHTHLAAYAPEAARTELLARRAAWASVRQALVSLASSAPGSAVLTREPQQIASACQRAMPLSAGPHAKAPDSVVGRHLLALSEVCGQIAAHNNRSLAALGDAGQVYVHASSLSGDRVTDSPALVQAKLDGRYVPASRVDVQPVLNAYRELEASSRHASHRHESPAASRPPVERIRHEPGR